MRNSNFLIVLFLSIFICTISSGYAQVTLPDTPVGEMARDFFDAYNSENVADLRDFTANMRTPSALERISVEERMESFKGIKKMIPDMQPYQVVKEEPGHLMVLIYSQVNDKWFKIGFTLSQDSPPLLEGFSIRPGRAPKPDSEEGDWNSLTELLNREVRNNNIPGISMVTIRNGRLDEIAVSGVREIGGPELIGKKDRFHLGSITKSMTATVIGGLIENKTLSLNTTLRDIFPGMDMQPEYESVTIKQLLDHRAGIQPYTSDSENEKSITSLTASPTEKRLAFTKLVLLQEPICEPGTTMNYSNAGYSILGAISEQLTQQSWEVLLSEYIFEPLNMKTAGVGWPNKIDNKSQPVGHYGNLGDLQIQTKNEYDLAAHMDPAGDVHSSMKDLAKFALAHLKGINNVENDLLKPSTLQKLHSPDPGQQYSSGWMIQKAESGKIIHEHAGSAGTFWAYMAIEPISNSGWVIAANAGDFQLDAIFRDIIEAYESK